MESENKMLEQTAEDTSVVRVEEENQDKKPSDEGNDSGDGDSSEDNKPSDDGDSSEDKSDKTE